MALLFWRYRLLFLRHGDLLRAIYRQEGELVRGSIRVEESPIMQLTHRKAHSAKV